LSLFSVAIFNLLGPYGIKREEQALRLSSMLRDGEQHRQVL
jgi:hypothetical protein